MRRKHLTSVLAVLALTTGTAHAEPASWTGFYVGGNLGGAWADTGFDLFQPACCHEPLGFSPGSVAGGAQVGWQYQWSNWVTGIELSYMAAELDETVSSRIIPDRTRSMEVSDIFLAGVRLGYALDRSLIYLKGGYASADVDITSHVASTNQLSGRSSGSEDGWNIGGGFERAFGQNIVLGVQYDYIDLGETNRSDISVPPFGLAYHLDIDAEIHAVTARLSYKLSPFSREPQELK
jgi:outer membrane immunogenic protein